MTDQTALVARIKADLVARGQTFTTNCDSFQITARVAWELWSQGAKLILKRPEQNGCTWAGVRYSHDAIAFSDGWADLLASAGPPANENRPSWQWHAGETFPADQLAYPFKMDAAPTPDPPTPWPPAPPPSPGDLSAVTATLLNVLLKTNENNERLRRLETTQLRGLSGTLFGYTIRLIPPKE